MSFISGFFNRLGNYTGSLTPKTATVAGTSGVIYRVTRLMGSSSVLALVTGTDTNLTINTTTGDISATSGIPYNVNQIAVVRESSGQLAMEYPVTLTGEYTPPVLSTLVLNGTLRKGSAASGVTITGATAGSTVTLSAAGLTVSGSGTTRTVSGTPTATGSFTATETLTGATNTPKTTAIGSVLAPAPVGFRYFRVTPNANGEGQPSSGQYFRIGSAEVYLTNAGSRLARTGWSASSDDNYGGNSPDRLLDGSIANSYLCESASTGTVTHGGRFVIDTGAGSSITPTGIDIWECVEYAGYNITGCTIEVSNDLTTWSVVGNKAAGTMVYSNGFCSIPLADYPGAAVTLKTLTLNGQLQQTYPAVAVTITNATAGSTITLNIAGLTVSGTGTTRTISGTPTTSGALTATETVDNGTNSPNTTPLGTVSGPEAVLPAQSAIVSRFSAASLALANGASVTSWASSVGTDTATADGAPTFRTGGLGGKPYVEFNGTQRMSLTSNGDMKTALSGTNYTALMVFQKLEGVGPYGPVFMTGAYNEMAIMADGTYVGGYNHFNQALPVEDQVFLFAGIVKDPLDLNNARGIVNGTLTTTGPAPGAGSTFRIGGHPDLGNTKFRLSELIVWNRALSTAEIVQFSKWAHEQHSQAYPWTALGRFTMFDGDSISSNLNGSGNSMNAVAYSVARLKGWKLGTYSYIGYSGKDVVTMDTTSTTRVDPVVAQLGSTPLHLSAFEYANHSAGTATDAINRSKAYITNRKAAGVAKIFWGTSTDVANGETAYGADPTRRAGYNNYDWVGLGGADVKVNIHLDATVGVEGACPATPGPYGPNFSDTVHPADPGYVALAAVIAAAIT